MKSLNISPPTVKNTAPASVSPVFKAAIDKALNIAPAVKAPVAPAVFKASPAPVVKAPTSVDIALNSIGVKVPGANVSTSPVKAPPVPVVLKTPTPADLTVKSVSQTTPVIKVPADTIFVPGLGKNVKSTEIANINPSIDILKAKHFLLVNNDVKVDYNEKTKEYTLPFSTGHTNIGFVTNGEIQDIFGKQPSWKGSPIAPGKIKYEAGRDIVSKQHDQDNGKSYHSTKIIPVTKEQYDAAYNYAKSQKDSGVKYFNVFTSNCNDFVNDVLQQAIPGKNLGQIYTAKELKDMAVKTDIAVKYGACNQGRTVTESIHVNVADKHKVDPSRVTPHPVDPSNPDIRHYTISPDNVCPQDLLPVNHGVPVDEVKPLGSTE